MSDAIQMSAASPPRPSRTGTLAEGVYAALRRAIIEQAVPPGTKLPEDQLGETFGVSRTVVRAALSRLAMEGLVEQEPNKRAQVASPSLEEGRDVFAVRRGLERMVMEALSGRLSPAQVADLRAHVGQEQDMRDQDSPEAIRLAGEFHMKLARMTGNDVLMRFVDEVASRCSLILALYGRPHSSECAVNEHLTIIDALHRGDAAEAARIMDEHLSAVATRGLLAPKPDRERDLRDMLQRYGDGPKA